MRKKTKTTRPAVLSKEMNLEWEKRLFKELKDRLFELSGLENVTNLRRVEKRGGI